MGTMNVQDSQHPSIAILSMEKLPSYAQLLKSDFFPALLFQCQLSKFHFISHFIKLYVCICNLNLSKCSVANLFFNLKESL